MSSGECATLIKTTVLTGWQWWLLCQPIQAVTSIRTFLLFYWITSDTLHVFVFLVREGISSKTLIVLLVRRQSLYLQNYALVVKFGCAVLKWLVVNLLLSSPEETTGLSVAEVDIHKYGYIFVYIVKTAWKLAKKCMYNYRLLVRSTRDHEDCVRYFSWLTKPRSTNTW